MAHTTSQELARLITELGIKEDEARINENLASICHELDRYLPLLKANLDRGTELTGAEGDRIRQLTGAYDANIARYKALKGFK